MIEYIKWVEAMFSGISPYTHEQAIAAVRSFMDKHGRFDYLSPEPLSFLGQGDVIGQLPFYYVNAKNERRKLDSYGMLLSNTCDAENDEFILFSPLLPLSSYADYKQGTINIATVKANCYTSLLYIPDFPLDDYVVDLSIANAFSREMITRLLGIGTIRKRSSLSLKGFYFFLSKLTVHLMRPEAAAASDQRGSLAS